MGRSDKLALLFPGQGSQRTGMLEDLRAKSPAFAAHLDALDRASEATLGRSIVGLVSRAPSAEHDRELTATDNAQPALGIYSLALARLAAELGVVADYFVGHSYGELSALAAAGVLDQSAFLSLSIARGALMAEAGALAPGAMLAVRAEESVVREHLPAEVVLANLNAPKQTVVSGSALAIDAAAARFDAAGIGSVRIRTACAFHSPLMAPVAGRFAEKLAATVISGRGADRVLSNVTAAPYEASADSVRDGLARQLTAPVRFRESIERLYALGVRTFVEVGPGRVLSDLVGQILAGRPHRAIALEPLGEGAVSALRELARVETPPVAVPSAEAAAIAASAERVLTSVLAHQREIARLAEGAAPADRARVATALVTSSERLLQDFLLTQRVALGLGASAVSTTDVAAPANASGVALVASAPEAASSASSAHERADEGLEAFLRRAIVDLTGFPGDTIGRDTDFERDLALDSITMVELFCQLMDRYPVLKGVGQELRHKKTVGAVLDALEPLVAPQPSTVRVSESVSEAVPDARTLVAAAMDRAESDLDDGAMLGADLGLDVFAREAVAARLVSASPAVAVAGRELLRDRTVGELVELVTSLVAPHASSLGATAPIEESTSGPSVVRRFTRALATRTGPVAAAALDGAVLLVGPAGQRLRALATLASSRGLRARTVVVGDAGFSIDGDDEMVGLHDAERLRERLAAILVSRPAALFLATPKARRSLAASDVDVRALDVGAAALFTLAKAVSTDDAARPMVSRLGVLAAGDVLLAGACGVARSLAREWSVPVRSATLAGETPPARVFDVLLGGESEHDLVLEGMRVSRHALVASSEPAARSPEIRATVRDSEAVLFLGGGRGITAEIAVALARRARCRIAVVGRTPLPTARPFADCSDDASLTARVRATLGAGASAEAVRAAVADAKRGRELWDTKSRVEAVGGQFFYRAADATRAGELADALSDLRAEAGPFVGVVHGVGLTEDARVGEKSHASFRRVLDVKVKSALLLRSITRGEPLRFAFFLSSLAAHAGTAGQTDYVAANEIVNAIADEWRRETDGSVNVRALLFSVWTEVGLAGAALKRQMDRLGLDGISSAEGAAAFLAELDRADDDDAWVLLSPESTLAYASGIQRAG